jgi:hypothetical protein
VEGVKFSEKPCWTGHGTLFFIVPELRKKTGLTPPQSAEGFLRRAVAEHFFPPRIGFGSVQLLSPNSLYAHTVFQHDDARLHDSPFTCQRPASVREDVSRFIGTPFP